MATVLCKFLWRLRLKHMEVLIMEDVICTHLLDRAKKLSDALTSLTSDAAADGAIAEEEEGEVDADEGSCGDVAESKHAAQAPLAISAQ